MGRTEPPGDRTLNLLIKSCTTQGYYEQMRQNEQIVSGRDCSCCGTKTHLALVRFSPSFPPIATNDLRVECADFGCDNPNGWHLF